MSTFVLTASLSEFRINPDRSIDRMSISSCEFLDWAPAGSEWERIVIGEPMYGTTSKGPFRTSPVVAVMWKDDQ